MIYIEKNKVNKIVLTLSETSRLTNPHFLFSFLNEYNLTSTPILFSTEDLSENRNRYNLFEIDENSSGSTSGGTSSLNLIEGQYEYIVYESSASTLSLSGTTGRVIEKGKMVVADKTNSGANENNTSKNIYR